MREKDIYNEIIDLGKSRGTLTYDEINDAFPSEFTSPAELEDFMNLLEDMRIKVIDKQGDITDEEEGLEEEERGEYDKAEDLVHAYFRSLGDIAILSRDEETELARKIEEGNNIIEQIVIKLPLSSKISEKMKVPRNISLLDKKEEDNTANEVIEKSLETLDHIMLQHNEAEPHGENKITVTDYLKMKYDRITRARNLVSQAKNQLIIHNLRLVVNIAKHYIGRGGLSFLDLIQEGNIGLMKAIDKFDYKMGFKFSTYATWWIRQGITRALTDQSKTIRVPVHMMELYNKVSKASKELMSHFGREASKEEIAEKLAVPTKKIEDLFRVIKDTIALQTPIGDDGSTIEKFIGDQDSPSPSSNAEQNEITEKILEILQTLPPKEEQIIKMRFGIGFDRDLTLEAVGKHFSISRERVRQIEAKALRKLKHPSRLNALRILNTT